VILALLFALAQEIRELDPKVGAPQRNLHDEARALVREVNRRETEAWRKIATKEDWERYRDAKLAALRASLGAPAEPPKDLKVRVTRTISGEGYRIENLVYESRPGLLVTANLYGPAQAAASMPGFVVIHSHHNPKTQGELQMMGITWARQGCLVLVMDQLGHGERRQHPFVNAESYKGPFRPTRQDYWFRYVTGMQLHAAGESLVGWMAWDVWRAVDLLLARPGVDPERIALLGSVAGGGDPCGVAAALDPRIKAAVPFNFGGPQPETKFPLPEDAELAFNYAGGGSWESTRNLRLSARDGFLPWAIVGAVAPRGLVYAHEFAWDQDRDPVWKRFEKLYGFYGVPERLAWTKGRGAVTGQAPEATHCNNIGAVHLRAGVYAAFERWFKLRVPASEAKERHTAEELACLDGKPRPLHEILSDLVKGRKSAELRKDWARLLGPIEPAKDPKVSALSDGRAGAARFEKLLVGDIPLLVLSPEGRAPLVIGIAQDGKAGFLKHRAGQIEALLKAGIAVAFPDVRGTGENGPLGSGRGRGSGATSLSATEQMLGRTLVGLRLADLRTVVGWARGRSEAIALWGDSFAAANPPDRSLAVPQDADPFPDHAEPLGGFLALFGALFEEDVKAVFAFGGLKGYASLLESPFCYVPHDAVVPGALTVGDLDDVAAALAPRPVRLEGRVDGLNRRVEAGATSPAAWLIENLKR
jgi:dienelactone hydrolase